MNAARQEQAELAARVLTEYVGRDRTEHQRAEIFESLLSLAGASGDKPRGRPPRTVRADDNGGASGSRRLRKLQAAVRA